MAKYLFCSAFGWNLAPNSERGFDARDADGTRYQIKGRRLHHRTTSRELSAIRDLKACHFDVLAGVLFDHDYGVLRAALIPRLVVEERAKFVAHTNSHRFMLQDDVWRANGVVDVTTELRAHDGPQVTRPAPFHGEHTAEVLAEMGIGPEAFQRLKGAGVV